MSCPRGFDPFDREADDAFRGHLDGCPYCANVVLIADAARRTWQDANARDDTSPAVFREQRLLRGGRRPPARVTFRWVAPALWFALGICIAVLAVRRLPTARGPGAVVASASASSNTSLVVSAPVVPPSSGSLASGAASAALPSALPATDSTPPSLVVVAHRNVSFAGSVLPTRGVPLTIPRGAHLTLGFAADAPLVDIDGPATIRREGAELALDEGAIDVTDAGALVVRTSHARVRLDHSACRIATNDVETRVERRSGIVTMEAIGGRNESRTISDATIVLCGADGTMRTGPREMPRPDADSAWNAALALLEGGDREGAEKAFRMVARDPRASARLRTRARFRSGELALGRHDWATGRAELEPLVDDADPALASDAALLLARAAETLTERAAIWERLLARDLPEPYRSHALRERAKTR